MESPRERDYHRGEHRSDPRTPPLPTTNLYPPPRDRPRPPQPPPPRAHAAAAATVATSCAVPLAGLRRPIPTPPQPPPVYNDWDGTGLAGPARKRTPSSRRNRLPGPSSLCWRLRPTRANVLGPSAMHAGRRSSRKRNFELIEGRFVEEVHYNTQEAPRLLRLRSSPRRLRKRARERAAPGLCERLRSSWFGGLGGTCTYPNRIPRRSFGVVLRKEIPFLSRLWPARSSDTDVQTFCACRLQSS